MTTKAEALLSLRPGAEWLMKDGALTWLDKEQTAPTESEISNEITRLDAVYASEKYKRDRAKEYPSLVDQLDDIYHNGIDGWKATIKKTKDKFPKP